MNLVQLLDDAGLTGRGGARFPTGVKLQSAIDRRAELIVNACDGEIGTHKDAYVVAEHLDELRHGAGLIARDVVWAAHRDSETERRLLDAGLDVLSAPPRYVASEESALVSLRHGGLGRPIMRTAPISFGARDARGKRLRPTLVLNAETVWRVSQIQQHGPDWFRGFGTAQEPGPRLVTVGGRVTRPGVYQSEAGASLRGLLERAGATDVRAVGVSGLSGGFVPGGEIASAIWSDAGLEPYGLTTGTGALRVLDRTACPLEYVSRMLSYAAGESAGQCGPCMFGVPAVAEQFERLAASRLPVDEFPLLQNRLGMLPGRGACRFPDGVSAFAASALRTFDADVRAHLSARCATANRKEPARATR